MAASTSPGHTLQPGEFDLALQAPEGAVAGALPGNDAVVTLDTAVTPELEREGTARDLVRQIQEARKVEGLEITDRIDLWVWDLVGDDRTAIEEHRSYIADQVLAVSVTLDAPADGIAAHTSALGSVGVRVAG